MVVTMKEQMNIVIAGHVDHGKSTIIGRLLADTKSLPEGKLEQVKQMCEQNAKPFEYAFLLDALKDERSQGITIDSARVFFKTQKRDYIIIDAPGHIEFLKNMISGAARAEAALLVVDAHEGIQENTRRHGYMLSMLGIHQVAVLVNKMDLVDYDEAIFRRIESDYTKFLSDINVTAAAFLPVSGVSGENVAQANGAMPWFAGHNVLSMLDEFAKEPTADDKPFRMPVQDVYKFTKMGDSRRIIAGTIDSGTVKVGDELVFYPSGKKSTVKTIEHFNRETQTSASTGQAVGFTLDEQIYLPRGEVATNASEAKPLVSRRIRISLFWLGKSPFSKQKEYLLKIGTTRIGVRLESIERVINASNLAASQAAEQVKRHEVAECTLQTTKAIAFDRATESSLTSRFVIVDQYEIAGGGIIRDSLEDKLSWVRDRVLLRNYKWEKSIIPPERRAEKYNQRSLLVLLTGAKGSGRKAVAKELEARLFEDGKVVYFLGIGNVLYGVDADLKERDTESGAPRSEVSEGEHLRRMAEVAHILLDAGVILLVTAIDLRQQDLEIIKEVVDAENIEVVWVGDSVSTDIAVDLKVPGKLDVDESVRMLKTRLQERGIIFRPW